MLSKGIYEVGKSFDPSLGYMPDLSKLIARADIIKGLPFMPLKDLIELKKALGRQKDAADIALIEKHLEFC
jgi:hypothetical protein